MNRRFPVGAEPHPEGGMHFRVWAPQAQQLSLILNSDIDHPFRMQSEADGYWAVWLLQAQTGDRYQFQLNEHHQLYPDPASFYQPEGPHAASCMVNHAAFSWEDLAWTGVNSSRQVLYEMHIGTFTEAGTFAAAAARLEALAALGITTITLMPVAEFDGDFGWGYDVVGFYAPYHVYGTPEDFKRFVNEAHRHGLAVILDVIYNHVGNSGAYLSVFSDHYYSRHYRSDWGAAINFDGPGSAQVRTYFIANAVYWIDVFHLDGLRFDATHFVYDASEQHVIAEMVTQARQAAPDKTLYFIGENEPQHASATDPVLLHGLGLDAVWNDDFHHSANVALHGKREAYFHDYRGHAQELVSSVKWGYLYQGQYYAWQAKVRGTPVLGKAASCFVHYLQNHDQIANSGFGRRIHQHAKPADLRAMTALLLLAPQTPMLFQGQEFAASAPFLFFADHAPELAASVEIGRIEFLSQFPNLQSPLSLAYLEKAESEKTFARCKLDHEERERHADIYLLHHDLLKLRRDDPVFADPLNVDGAVLSETAFLFRFFANPPHQDRLLLVNLAADVWFESVAEPLLAPPAAGSWQLAWSSEHPKYGAEGIREIDLGSSFALPHSSAQVFAAVVPSAQE